MEDRNKQIRKLSLRGMIISVIALILLSGTGYYLYGRNYCYNSAKKNYAFSRNGEMMIAMKYEDGESANTVLNIDSYVDLCMQSKFGL